MVTRYRKSLLAVLTSTALLFTLLFSLAGVATAHSGSIVASETCQSWSVSVSLANNVTSDRTVDVITTIPGTTGITGGHYDTSFGQIWQASGAAPATGTVTLNVYNGASLEFTTSASIAPAENCASDAPPTLTPTSTPFQSFQGETATPTLASSPTITASPTAGVTEPPKVQLTLTKVLCPSYSVVPANRNPTSYDATGGHGGELDTSYQTALVNPATDIPTACSRAEGWQFQLYGGWSNGTLSPPIGSPLTTGAGGGVSVWLDASEQALAASTSNGIGLWVAEIQQPSVAAFGALRCYTDILNGDNVETISGLTGGDQHIYCIAYNVLPNRATPSPAESASPVESFQGETATPVVTSTPFESFQGETATPGQTTTPPPTSTATDPSGHNSTPLVALLICVGFGGLGLVAVEIQRRSIRR